MLKIVLSLVLVASAASAEVVYIKAGRLIVDASQAPIAPGAVVISDGMITASGPNVTPPASARQIDLSAYTVMPSLIDAHIHLGGGAPREAQIPSPALSALKAAPGMAYALESGVAAVRVLGSGDFVDVALRNAIDDGTIPGPHVLPAGHALSIIGGHGDRTLMPYTVSLADLYTPANGFVSSPADAEKAVQLQIKYGARVIKLMASGGVGSPLDFPGDANLSFEEMRVACEQAHMHHIKVAAHAENLRSILDAMKAGVDSIEHGSELDQEAVDYMKAHHVIYVPTVNVVDTYEQARSTASEVSKVKARNLAKSHFASFALALKNDVTMAAGSDNGYRPGGATVYDEVVTDVKYGMDPRKALQAATTEAAALLGFNKLGTLAPGMEGDLVAVQGDPLTDIQSLKRVRFVVFQGKIIRDSTR